jgi:hypothetical protein
MPTFTLRISCHAFRQFTAIAMITFITAMLIPAPAAAAAVRTTDRTVREGGAQVWSWLVSTFDVLGRSQNINRDRKGVRPAQPLTKAEREARVARLELNVASEIELKSRQRSLLSAVPVDEAGNAVQGLSVEWKSGNKEVIFIRKSGEALAGMPGMATLIASAGSKYATVRVRVIEGTKEPFGGKKRVDSTRDPKQEALGNASRNTVNAVAESRNRRKRAHAKGRLSPLSVMPFIRDPNDDPLPDNETSSLYQTNNLIGAPPGKTKPGALSEASSVSRNRKRK